MNQIRMKKFTEIRLKMVENGIKNDQISIKISIETQVKNIHVLKKFSLNFDENVFQF